jgi:hypothetical protein
MIAEPSLAVTLSAELYELLTSEARKLGLPLEWLVASLVVDTVDAGGPKPAFVFA